MLESKTRIFATSKQNLGLAAYESNESVKRAFRKRQKQAQSRSNTSVNIGIKLTSMRQVSNFSDLQMSTRNDELLHRKRASVFLKKEEVPSRTFDGLKSGSTVLDKSPRLE